MNRLAMTARACEADLPLQGPDSPPYEGGEDVQEAEDSGTSFDGGGGEELEFEEIEAGQAFDGGTAGDCVVAGSLTRRGTTRALSHVLRLRRNIENSG